MSTTTTTITLESILELKSKHQFYHDFILYLQHTYCLENLLFYQDVQDYRSNRSTSKKYQLIISRYILVNSPHEINIPCDMREALITNTLPTQDSFDEAAEAVLELMRVNSFLPWWYELQNNTTCSSAPLPQTINKKKDGRRNTLTTSFSVPEHRWHHMFSVSSRPSFSSLRDVSTITTLLWEDSNTNKEKKSSSSTSLFTRKKQALLYRVKRTFTVGGSGRGDGK